MTASSFDRRRDHRHTPCSNAAASYQLYQYFLQVRLDREAVYFENRAIGQGYTPPPRLDPKRG
jgi:hypothetical protein